MYLPECAPQSPEIRRQLSVGKPQPAGLRTVRRAAPGTSQEHKYSVACAGNQVNNVVACGVMARVWMMDVCDRVETSRDVESNLALQSD